MAPLQTAPSAWIEITIHLHAELIPKGQPLIFRNLFLGEAQQQNAVFTLQPADHVGEAVPIWLAGCQQNAGQSRQPARRQ